MISASILDFKRLSWLISVSYGLAGITDFILAGSLIFVLHLSRTGTRRADSLLDTLIIYTINTGVLTSICSMLAFVFALILPGNLIYAGISIVGTKLYANSVLAVLNSRRAIGEHFVDDYSINHIHPSAVQSRRDPHTSTVIWNAPQRSLYLSERTSVASEVVSEIDIDSTIVSEVAAEGERPAGTGDLV
ncbi:hypothetical protein C8Q77DRAFT_1149679 [Trametes polyzona]|nr:hypothetical protein C8Q77DRAFT_1149679 [Trametes polyzona]